MTMVLIKEPCDNGAYLYVTDDFERHNIDDKIMRNLQLSSLRKAKDTTPIFCFRLKLTQVFPLSFHSIVGLLRAKLRYLKNEIRNYCNNLRKNISASEVLSGL